MVESPPASKVARGNQTWQQHLPVLSQKNHLLLWDLPLPTLPELTFLASPCGVLKCYTLGIKQVLDGDGGNISEFNEELSIAMLYYLTG